MPRNPNKLILYLIVLLCLSGCSNSKVQQDTTTDDPAKVSPSNEIDTDLESTSECDLDDDTYGATIDYYNPTTSYSATYTLDVEVEGCKVTVIHFNNGGYLDDDHIAPEEIDGNGDATVKGEDGKTYQVHIDN